MLRTVTLAVAAFAAFGLSACDRVSQGTADPSATPAETPVTQAPTAPELPVRPEAVTGAAAIDWDAARADLAALSEEERQTGFQVATGETPPPVPVLMLNGNAMAASEGGPRFQPTEDGYFVVVKRPNYEIIVNGTNEVIGPRGDATGTRNLSFLPTASGAQVSFQRYGADYLIQFECTEASGEDADCISEAEAIAVAEDLVIAGTR